jgi:hypothetical protein
LRSGYKAGAIELTWDDPSTIGVNQSFRILGTNIYRSFDSEYGPFERITEVPVGSCFWRDITDNVLVPDEDVSTRFTVFGERGNNLNGLRYVFKTLRPIVKEGSQAVPADSPLDVRVWVDGVQARVKNVRGASGEVELDVAFYPEVGTQSLTAPVIPGEDSQVICAYRYTRSLLKTDLAQRIFYRITTVGYDASKNGSSLQPEDLVETPLDQAVAVSSYETEKLDYMWKEAIRRNRWILNQGGERVKIFLRKYVGLQCPCVPDDYHKQAVGDCRICFSTGIVRGFEGPYDALVAPPDGEKRIVQGETGLRLDESYEVWTGPSPILSQRDFLVKVNGERYVIGPVRFPSNRGMILQQHFTIAHIDEKDIRSFVPVDNPVKYSAVQFVPSGPELSVGTDIGQNLATPQEREIRGRTRVWENENE